MMASKKGKTTSKQKGTPKRSPSSSKKEANIQKTPSGYRIQVSVDGKRVSKSVKTKKEALKVRTSLKKAQKAVIKVSRVSDVTEGKKAQKTYKRLKEGGLKVVSGKTGKKEKVEAISFDELKSKLSKSQKKEEDKGKGFYQDVMDGKIVPAMMAISEDQNVAMFIRYAGDLIKVNAEQLSNLVSLVNKSYDNYSKERNQKSPVNRFRYVVEPDESVTLNLDKSFFNDDQDDPFDISESFFEWGEDF